MRSSLVLRCYITLAVLLSGAAFGAPKVRIARPVKGLYQSINPNEVPHGWSFTESDQHGYSYTMASREGVGERRGYVTRHYEPRNRRLIAYSATRFDGRTPLPAWIQTESVPLVKGRGTPTIAYLTLRLMKMKGVPYGGLKELVAVNIANPRSAVSRSELLEGGSAYEDAIRKTHTFQYLETVLTQSGHRILSVDLGASRYHQNPRSEWGAPWLRKQQFSTLLGYDMRFKLAPL